MSRILYKYISIEGAEWMLGMKKGRKYPNLQFTNATQLNDPFDCHPKLLDYSNVPKEIPFGRFSKEWWQEKVENDALNLRNNTWLTSFSKENDSILMWSHYCNNHSGICIGMDIEKIPPIRGMIFPEPIEIEVQYADILNRPNVFSGNDFMYYQFGTKAQDWGYEKEVRLVIPKPLPGYADFTPEQAKEAKKNKHKLWDWKEIHHYVELPPECFESVYFGVYISNENIEKISERMLKLNRNTKLYQMQLDPDAFRLKAERINCPE